MNRLLKILGSAVAVIMIIHNAAAAIDKIELEYEKCRRSYQDLIGSKKMKMRHNWVKVIKCFEDIHSSDSRSKRVIDATFTLGQLYSHLYTYSSIESDLNNSLRFYEKVAQNYPKSNLADDSLYKRAKIFYDIKKDYTKAYIDLSELLDKYPTGDSKRRAKELLSKIRKERPEQDYAESPEKSNVPRVSTSKTKKPVRLVVEEIKHWTNPDYTRVAIYLNGKADYNYNTLGIDKTNLMPRRVYVDIKDAEFSSHLAGKIPIKDGLLSAARIGKFKSDVSRIVLDAEKDFEHSVVAWEDPFRIIIDIKSKSKIKRPAQMVVDLADEVTRAKPFEVEIEDSAGEESDKKGKIQNNEKAEKKVAFVATPPPKRSRSYIKRVVIDAGHGGEDTGAIGRYKTMEKDVVLNISKKLRDILSRFNDIEVIMTREDDIFIPLEERTGMAVQANADLFVSVHADAHKNRKVRGISTYFLGDTDDKDSIMTALMENYSKKDYVSALNSKETKDFLSYTFVSLQKNYDAKRSIPLADSIQKSVVKNLSRKYGNVKNRGVRQGIFWVLCGTNSPAVLIEVSYISNPTEEKRLRSDSYQEHLARGIAEGIRKYLKNPVAMSGYDYISKRP